MLVGIPGAPTGLDRTFWRIAVPVAAIEAVFQAVSSTTIVTTIFGAAHLMVIGMAQVWVFQRFGFVWMLAFRLADDAIWHVGRGVARLELLF